MADIITKNVKEICQTAKDITAIMAEASKEKNRIREAQKFMTRYIAFLQDNTVPISVREKSLDSFAMCYSITTQNAMGQQMLTFNDTHSTD